MYQSKKIDRTMAFVLVIIILLVAYRMFGVNILACLGGVTNWMCPA